MVVQEYREVVTPSAVVEEHKQVQPKEELMLAGAWNMYKKEKHSICHSASSSAMAGWVKNILHLQQTVGHEKSGGITKRYLHTFPLSSVSYVIDGID